MLKKALISSALAFAIGVTTATAQQQTGEIFGRAADTSGAVLPGATVTVASAALFQPRVAVTSAAGTYRIAELPIGTYSVTFELRGFRTMAMPDIRVTIGFRAQVNASMELSTVRETVTVSGASPLVDTREVGTKSSFDLETLQNIPSARDPWVMLERTPGIFMDRANVGGNQSGQQSGYISRGSSTGNNKWSIDGVDITDMSATGASPIYYDFDMLEEMQVTTGGADVTQQTGGVGINLVTKSGTDRFKGNARFLITDQKFQGDNITDELRAQGAGAGAPIQNIRDYGFDVGGPIVKSKLWYWSSYGTQAVNVGVVGFYKNNATCRPGGVAINPRTTDTQTLRDCLETDLTTLNNYNWKLTWVPFTDHRFNFQNTWAEKVRNARDASDLRPIETAVRQKAVDSAFGPFGWLTGPGPFWKAADQHVISDRTLVDVMGSHLGNNFSLDFQEPALADVQPAFETTTGAWSRSFNASSFIRPTNSLDVVSTYFLPTAGGDHSFKFGYRWRNAHSTSFNHRGGFIEARFTNGVANAADIWRDSNQILHLDTHAFYMQDTFTRNRLTINLGLRFDRQDDSAQAGRVPENPIFPRLMPSIDFQGADAGVVWNDLSPRVGLTYDLTGNGHTVFSASYATYYGQMSPGQLSGQLAATSDVFVRYPWSDTNGDRFVQAGEVNTSVPFLNKSTAYDPANPTSTSSPTRVDPYVKNDRTREFIVGFDRQLGSQMAFGGSYIWRNYDRFVWNDHDNFTSANYRAVTFQPTCTVAGARCDTVTYFEPTVLLPSANTYTNIPDRYRNFNGVEFTFAKRMANRWAMNASYAYNDAVDVWDSPNAYEDPTCTASTVAGANPVIACPGEQVYAPESAGSGIGNVFQNAKWLLKLNGRVQLPYSFNLAANYLGRQGFPFPQTIQSPARANGAGQIHVHIDPLGANRYDTLHTVDLRLDRAFQFGGISVVPAVDLFNLTNTNTVQAMNKNQSAANANQVSGILPPRIARFGVAIRW